MAVVKPFRAVRYVPSRVQKVQEVFSPPFDALTPELQLRLHLRSPFNAVRLELGQDQPEDDAAENRHVRAGDFWKGWRDQGVLRRDSVPGFYLYEQVHATGVRRGLFGAVRLEDAASDGIRPLEETLSEQVSERLQLLRGVQANVSPIVAMYEDPHQIVAERFFDLTDEELPLLDVTDDVGVQHRLWYVNAPDALATLQDELESRTLVLADGHHRYAAALAYRDEQHAKTPNATGDEAWNYALMLLVDVEDPGLQFQPRHLLVNPGTVPGDFLTRLEASFIVGEKELDAPLPEAVQVEEALYDLSEAAERKTRIGMQLAGQPRFFILTMHEGVTLRGSQEARSAAWKRLDLSRLRGLILEPLLGMKAEDWTRPGRLATTPDFREVLMGLGSERYPLAFYLNPAPPEQLWELAMAGDRLPPRSTALTPWVPAGILFHSLEGTL